MAQGFGLSHTHGVEDFPNGDANKAGSEAPFGMIAHLFLRQTIGLGGEPEDVPDGPLQLAGEEEVSRLTLTLGKLSPLDIFDNNAYASDPHSQFFGYGWEKVLETYYDFKIWKTQKEDGRANPRRV